MSDALLTNLLLLLIIVVIGMWGSYIVSVLKEIRDEFKKQNQIKP